MNLHFSTQKLNEIASSVYPGGLVIGNTTLAYFFRKYLFQKAIAQFKPTILEHWPENLYMYLIFGRGYVSIFDTPEFGKVYTECGLSGFDVFYQPVDALVSNPLLPRVNRLKIGRDCAIIRLQPTYTGITDICKFYGDLLALAAETATTNLFNSRVSFIFTAPNTAKSETLKKLYRDISSGQPAVFADKNVFIKDESGKLIPAWQMFQQNVGQNYIVDDILSDMRKIEAMFDAQVGIPNANTDKKERLIGDEVNANNVSTYSNMSMWLENLQRGCEQAHKLFGLTKKDLWFDWRFPPTQQGGDDYSGDVINPGTSGLRPNAS